MTKSKLSLVFKNWQAQLRKRLAEGEGLRKKFFSTSSGIELPDLFFASDTTTKGAIEGVEDKRVEGNQAESCLEQIGFPGSYPFTRGVQSTMYRGRLWTMRQYAGFGTAAEANQRYRYLLSRGTTGLSVAFDLPTQMGRDSDHPLSCGEVGRVGVAIDSIEDMEQLFVDIPLEGISTSMTINSTAHILLAFYLGVARRRGISTDKLRGTIQNDILKEYIARGTYIYPPKQAMKIVTDVFEYCRVEVPAWNTISISGYHIREAGSTAVQEVAFTLANGIAYVSAALERGLTVDEFAPRLAFFFNCHNNFLEEIAKFRAARRLWARIMKQRFKAQNDRSCMLRFHTQTAGSTLTAQQPQVNTVRTTIQALAAVLGGTQSLHTNSYDEALCLPSEETALLALRTQQVIAYESGIADVVDPFAGSYAIESLTDEIERRSADLIEKIDQFGGMLGALEAGFPQREIEQSAYDYQLAIERGEQIVVGVNKFQGTASNQNEADSSKQASESQLKVKIMKVDPRLELEQVEKLRQRKAARDSQAVSSALSQIERAAKDGQNIMPSVCDSVLLGVTLGEISDVLRACYGEYRG